MPPPHPSTDQSYTCNTAISKIRNTATPHYSAVRVNTMSDSQLQNTATSHYCSAHMHDIRQAHTNTTIWLWAHAHHQEAWCTTTYSRDLASRTPTVILVILINLVTHGY
jgi:hypothetical protein